MEERVFAPAGMTGATMRVSDLTAEVAHGHSGAPGGPSIPPEGSYYGDPGYGPMGGAWASADDLVRLAQSAALARQAEPLTPTGESPGQRYGWGLFLESGAPVIAYHGGSVEGFLSDLTVVPEAGVAVALLVNADWYFPYEIETDAIFSFVDYAPGPDEPAPTAEQLVGSYDSVVFGAMTVRAEGSGLVVDFVDHGYTAPLALYDHASYDVEWRPEQTTIPITFWRESPDAPASYIVSRWGVAHRQ
jgi:CubicO group peptidase (beta-lactamase class C family)